MNLVYVYKYENEGELFGVEKEMTEYDYELASIKELDREEPWGDFVMVEEGRFKWDNQKKDYMRV